MFHILLNRSLDLKRQLGNKRIIHKSGKARNWPFHLENVFCLLNSYLKLCY